MVDRTDVEYVCACVCVCVCVCVLHALPTCCRHVMVVFFFFFFYFCHAEKKKAISKKCIYKSLCILLGGLT